MPAKILYAIPPRHNELVRDRIASILVTELTSQFQSYGNAAAECEVYAERKIALAFPALPAIIVSLATISFDNKSAGSTDGNCIYNIDILCDAKADGDEEGDKIANVRMQALAGLCQAILDDEHYRTLDFEEAFIGNVHCSDLNIAQQTNEDARNNAHGRLTLSVRITEETQLPNPDTPAQGVTTGVTLEETAYGYQYSYTP